MSAEELCSRLIRAGEALGPYLRTWIDQVSRARKIVLEGEGIHPELIATIRALGLGTGVLVLETDPIRLYQTLLGRSTRFQNLSDPRRHAVVAMNRQYGLWLRERAERLHVPWLNSQPWASLADRIVGVTVNTP